MPAENSSVFTETGHSGELSAITHPGQFVTSEVRPTKSAAVDTTAVTALEVINALYVVIGLLGIVGNLFSCVIIVCYQPLRQRIPNYFLINQCVLDLTVGLILIMTMALTMNNVTGPSFVAYCYLINSRLFFTGTFTSSIYNIAALSVERYLSIVHPIRHKMWLTRRKVIGILIVIWIAGLTFKSTITVSTTRVVGDQCLLGQYPNMVTTRIAGLFNALGEFFLPLSVIAFCYIQMARAVRKIKAANAASGEQMSKVSLNVLKILGLVSLAFLVSVGPRVLYGIKYTIFLQQVDFYGAPYLFCVLLNYSNCCINPIIYMFKYEEFKKGVKALLYPRRPDCSVTQTCNCANNDEQSFEIDIAVVVAKSHESTSRFKIARMPRSTGTRSLHNGACLSEIQM